MRQEVYLFDLDGTLLDTYSYQFGTKMNYFERVLNRYFKSKRLDSISDIKALVDSNKVLKLFKPMALKAIDYRLAQIYSHAPLKPGVKKYLAYLKANHKKIALCTNNQRTYALKALRHHEIYDYFDLILTDDEVSFPKPNCEIYLRALLHFKVDKDDAFVFEDSWTGIKAARRLKLNCIGINELYQLKSHSKIKKECVFMIDDFMDERLYR